ncbi:MAG: antibiotic biosynthesis monooxygenase family protein [Candidatus Rokuibacteriota bacterium]
MTIVTYVTLKEGAEPHWDTAMRERLTAARDQPGWIGGQLLTPLDELNKRVIVGNWLTRAAWEAWHTDPAFKGTRARLEGLEAAPSQHSWHEVIEDIRRPGAALDAAA